MKRPVAWQYLPFSRLCARTANFREEHDERLAWLEDRRAVLNKALADYHLILLSAGFSEEQIAHRLVEKNCASICEVILEEQDKLHCCIVVVGRRGLRHNEEFIFGSTSSKVLHHARNCAVMVVE